MNSEEFSAVPSEVSTQLGARVLIRTLAGDDESAFIDSAKESLQFHQKWIKLPTDSVSFRRYLSGFDREKSFCFAVCDAELGSIAGSVSLTGIEDEPYYRGRLGYGVFERYARMGYMAAGLEYVMRFAFEERGLHRLEADIQRENIPSRRLVEKMRFRCEGISRGFIRINGEWIDHERWALTIDDWRDR